MLKEKFSAVMVHRLTINKDTFKTPHERTEDEKNLQSKLFTVYMSKVTVISQQ